MQCVSKPAEHPSGAKQTVCIRLSPHHLELLDKIAAEQGRNRSNTVARLVERAAVKAS